MISNLFYGERVRLTALRHDDAHTFADWYEDGTFSRLFDGAPALPKSDRDMEKWIEDATRERGRYAFALRLHYSDELIGVIELDNVYFANGTGSIAIGIGDASHRGKGYGAEAVALLLKFAFWELNLHRVGLTVFSYNDPAIALYEKLGFKREGVMREMIQRDGQHYDMLLYGLLKSEWQSGT